MRQTLTEDPAINTAARNAQLDIFPKIKRKTQLSQNRVGIRLLPLIILSTFDILDLVSS